MILFPIGLAAFDIYFIHQLNIYICGILYSFLILEKYTIFVILFYCLHKTMTDIRAIYNAANKIITNSEIDGYLPPRIYTGLNGFRCSSYKRLKRSIKDNPKKNTFIDLIVNREKKLPSPNTYTPLQYQPQYKKNSHMSLADRVTIFQQSRKQNQKNPTPSPQHYETMKYKQKSCSLLSFQKAQNTNYLDAALYNSTQSPGVGEYNLKLKSMSKLGKFDKAKRSQSYKQNLLPCAVTYYPKILGKDLFNDKKAQKKEVSNLPKQKRFSQKQDNPNKKLFYAQISEWGMKTKYKKKDILSVLSNHNIYSKSVYYN